MKTKRINKIVSVVLTAALLASLVVGLAASPAAAGANKWTKFASPSAGADNDWFMGGAGDDDITLGPGPWARAIDGTFYLYAQIDGDDYMFKSSDARAWERLDKYNSANGGQAVDIAVSSKNAGTVYVIDTANKIWYTTNSGARWQEAVSLTLPAGDKMTAIAVGYQGDNALIYVSTTGVPGTSVGTVWRYSELLENWEDTDLVADHFAAPYSWDIDTKYAQVFDVAVSPKYSSDRFVVAIVMADINADGTYEQTYATYKYASSTWGSTLDDAAFDPTGTAEDPDDVVNNTVSASIWIPDDFDSDEEGGKMQFFVGINSNDAEKAEGDVYRITTKTASDRNIKGSPPSSENVWAVNGVGNVGSANVLAGQPTGRVYYTTSNGTTWSRDRKRPTGLKAYPVVAKDFATSKEAWAAVDGNGIAGAVSRSTNGGDFWNQISMIDGDMDQMNGIEPSPNYSSDKTVFAITGPDGNNVTSVWKYDGKNWERINSAGYGSSGPGTLQTVERDYYSFEAIAISRTFATDNTVILLDPDPGDPAFTGPLAFRSTDGGGRFSADLTTPFDYFGEVDNFNAWVVIDKDTRLVGGDDTIYRTINGGDTWTRDETVDGPISTFGLDPNNKDNVLAANEDGVVYLSTNGGRTWKQRPTGAEVPDLAGGDRTFVAFDPNYAKNNIIYAADEDGDVYRAAIGTDDEWMEISGDDTFDTWPEEILGLESANVVSAANIVMSPDGTFYITSDDEPVARCINPAAPDEPERDAPYFEEIFEGWDDSPGDPFTLRLTRGTAANLLWTIATDDTPDEIWTYNDEIVAPVLSGPADGSSSGRELEVSVSWKSVPNADKYNVWWDIDPGFPNVGEDVNNETVTTTSFRITGLEPGRTYYWKVVVLPQEPAVSPFSARWSFTTGLGPAEWNPFVGGIPEAPTAGATNVPVKPSFAWNPADWATGYEFVLATNTAYSTPLISKTGANALTGTTYLSEQTLAYSTTYYWRVRAISKTSQSAWAEGVFTTVAAPPPPPTPPPSPPPAPKPTTPAYIWVIIGIGAALVIAVIILIIRTRRVA